MAIMKIFAARRLRLQVLIAITTCAASIMTAAHAFGQEIAGTYVLVGDSDGTKPRTGAKLELTFSGSAAGKVKLFATRPGETVHDDGTYSIKNHRMTIRFKEVDWAGQDQPFEFDGCTLTLPFKAVSATEGPGTSAWQREDPKCAGQKSVAPQNSGQKPLTAFSADEIITSGGGKQQVKIYATEKALRSESQAGGRASVTIVRSDRNIMWVLDPQTKTYSETPFTLGGGTGLFQSGSSAPGCSNVGEEQIGPYHCQKQVCNISAAGKNGSETQWAAKELGGLVIRYTDGVETLDVLNVKAGPQDPALFQVPAGYQKRP